MGISNPSMTYFSSPNIPSTYTFLHHNPRCPITTSHTASVGHKIVRFSSTHPILLPRRKSFPDRYFSPIFYPHIYLPSEASTTPALKIGLISAYPARLQSCPCLYAPISTPTQHPTSRPLHPHPIPNLPGAPHLEQTPPPDHGRNLIHFVTIASH